MRTPPDFGTLQRLRPPAPTMTLMRTGGRSGGAAVRLTNGAGFATQTGPQIRRDFTSLPNGEAILKAWVRRSPSLYDSAGCGLFVAQGPIGIALQAASDSSFLLAPPPDDDPDWFFLEMPVSVTISDGTLQGRLGWGDIAFFQACEGSIWFTEIEVWVDGVKKDVCAGSDAGSPGSGTGGGSEGTDPVPDPAPATTVRPFGAFSIPTTGAGNWNCTVKSIRPAYIANGLLSQATANGLTLFGQMAGGKAGWTNPDGTFSLTRWKRRAAR